MIRTALAATRAAVILATLVTLPACDSFRTTPPPPYEVVPHAVGGTRLSLTPGGLLLALPGPNGVAAVQVGAVEHADVLFRAGPGPGVLLAAWESDAASAVFRSEPDGAAHHFTLDLNGVTAPYVTARLLNDGAVTASVQVSPDSTLVLGTSSAEATSFHVVRLSDGTTVIRVDTEQQPMGGAYITSPLFGVESAFMTDIEFTLEGLPGGVSTIRVEAPRKVAFLKMHAR